MSLGREMAYILSHTLKGLYTFSFSSIIITLKAYLSIGRKFRLKNNIGKANNLSVSLENSFYIANQIALYKKDTYFERNFELRQD